MSQRQADLLRMRDMLEHLHLCHQQLQEFDEPNTVHYLTETMLRNLESCRRLCQNLHGVMKLGLHGAFRRAVIGPPLGRGRTGQWTAQCQPAVNGGPTAAIAESPVKRGCRSRRFSLDSHPLFPENLTIDR
jgi:hypothetical protein